MPQKEVKMKDQEILFTTETRYTFDEYVRYSDRVCRFANILSYVLWLGIGGALAVWAFLRADYGKGILVLIPCLLRVLQGPKRKKELQKKEFEDPEGLGNTYQIFDFYDDCFMVTSNMVPLEPVRYFDLTKIIETNTNFYLMYAWREGYVIVKENCSPELIQFLHEIKEDAEGPLYNENVKVTADYGSEAHHI